MSGRPVKHSLTLQGHRTSVSLEDEFWDEFRNAAAEERIPINALAARIDATRDPEVGLASSIRVYLLKRLQAQLSAALERQKTDPGAQ